MKLARKMKKKKAMLCALVSGAMMLCPIGVSHAEKQAKEYSFDQIVVTATKTARSVKDVPASVSVITAEEIKNMHVDNIDQVLVRAAGVFDSRARGNVGQPTPTVLMRGFSNASSVLVLLDGQPLNDAYSGVVPWSVVPVDRVERVEIVKGPGATLYGSSAMGGVINIITKTPKKAEASVSTRWETNNTWVNTLNYSDKLNEKLSFRFDVETKNSGGYKSSPVIASPTTKTLGTVYSNVTGWEATTTSTGTPAIIVGDQGNNQWDEHTLSGKLIYQFDPKHRLSFSMVNNAYYYTYGAEINLLQRNGASMVNTSTTGFSANGKTYQVLQSAFYGTPGGREWNLYNLNYADTEDGWTFNTAYTDITRNWNMTGLTSSTPRVQEKPNSRFRVDLQKELRLGRKDAALFGLSYGIDKMQSNEYFVSNWRDASSKTGVLYAQARGNARSWAIYGQDEHKFSDKWSMTAGLRYDSWTTYDGMIQPLYSRPVDYYEDRTESALSPKVALQYNVDKGTNLYFSWSKAFAAPDLYRIFSASWSSTSQNIANPELKPQKVSTFEVGLKKSLTKQTSLNFALFHNDVTDLIYKRTIQGSGTAADPTITQYQNAGEGSANGVELELNHSFSSQWSGFLNYSWQRSIITKNPANSASEGKLVPALPEHMLRLGVEYQKGKWTGSLIGIFASKQYSSDTNDDTTNGVYGSYDPYFIANLKISYQLDKQNTVTLGINNLFDAQYYSYYPDPGRLYSLEFKHKF